MVSINDKIINKAKELGKMIAESNEYKRMKNAESAQFTDYEAKLLIQTYNDKRMLVTESFKDRKPEPGELEAAQKEIQEEFDRILENAVINEYIKSREAYENLVNSVNDIINFYVTGEENSCGDKCSECRRCGCK